MTKLDTNKLRQRRHRDKIRAIRQGPLTRYSEDACYKAKHQINGLEYIVIGDYENGDYLLCILVYTDAMKAREKYRTALLRKTLVKAIEL